MVPAEGLREKSLLPLRLPSIFFHWSDQRGMHAVYGHSFRKLYNDQDYMSATFVRLVKLNPSLNTHISREELNHVCCSCVVVEPLSQ